MALRPSIKAPKIPATAHEGSTSFVAVAAFVVVLGVAFLIISNTAKNAEVRNAESTR